MTTSCHARVAEADRFHHVIFHGAPKLRPSAARSADALRPLRKTEPEPQLPEDHDLPAPAGPFLQAILRQAGLRPQDYRARPLLRRMPACLRALKVASIEDAARLLEREPGLWVRALDALMIGVTSFYRDNEVFNMLRRRMLPELLAEKRGLDVWSVGCSDGAELRTVAALLWEAGALEQSRLRGTDCRPEAISAARRARYAPATLAAMPVDLKQKCFRLEAGLFEPAGALASISIEWETGDSLAVGDQPEPQWDLILCRNMAIYLSVRAAEDLWRRLERRLRPGGLLVLGKAERAAAGTLRGIAPCIYRKEPTASGSAIQG